MNELYDKTTNILGESNINFARMIFSVEEIFSRYDFPYGFSTGIDDNIVLNITADIFEINMFLAKLYENGNPMTKEDRNSYYIAQAEGLQDLIDQCALSTATQMANYHNPDEEISEMNIEDTKGGQLYVQITLKKVLKLLTLWFKTYKEYPVAKVWAFASLRFDNHHMEVIGEIMEEITKEES